MADLSVMNVDGALYITEAKNATKLQAELDGLPLTEPGKTVPTGGVQSSEASPPVGGAGTKTPAPKTASSGKQ